MSFGSFTLCGFVESQYRTPRVLFQGLRLLRRELCYALRSRLMSLLAVIGRPWGVAILAECPRPEYVSLSIHRSLYLP
jgi:hypothetical protein